MRAVVRALRCIRAVCVFALPTVGLRYTASVCIWHIFVWLARRAQIVRSLPVQHKRDASRFGKREKIPLSSVTLASCKIPLKIYAAPRVTRDGLYERPNRVKSTSLWRGLGATRRVHHPCRGGKNALKKQVTNSDELTTGLRFSDQFKLIGVGHLCFSVF